MEIDTLQLGATFMLSMGLVEIIKLLINKFVIKNGNGKKDNTQDIDLAVLKMQMQTVLTNHIPHIEKALEDNRTEHKETQAMLSKIMAKLDI